MFADFRQKVFTSSLLDQSQQDKTSSGGQELLHILHDDFGKFIAKIVHNLVREPEDALDDLVGTAISTETVFEGFDLESLLGVVKEKL
jgi:hypothetical protein